MASHREEDNDLVVLKAGIDITSASAAACCCTKYYVTTVVEFQGYYEKHKGPLGPLGPVVPMGLFNTMVARHIGEPIDCW